MNKSLSTAVFCVVLAGSAFGAGLGKSSLHGTYVEARTADVFTGPCYANAETSLVGNLAVMGWHISEGSYDGVRLDGLGVVGVLRANSTLGDITSPTYPVKSVLIIDERATPEQRLALQKFARRMGGDLLQDVVKISYEPIQLEVKDNNVHSSEAVLKAGNLAEIRTRAIQAIDHLCRNETVWYTPLTKVEHAMPAVTEAHSYQGDGLDTRWKSPGKRSAFVATFQLND